jgi:hypothetical protein
MLSDLEWSVRLRGLNELQRDQVLQEAGRQWMSHTWREEPLRLVKLTAAKIARTWSPMPLSSDYSRPLYRAVGLIYTIPLDVLVVVSLYRRGLRRSAQWLLLLPAVYFTMVHALSVGSLRYRVPVEVPLAVLAAAAVAPMKAGQFRRVEAADAE